MPHPFDALRSHRYIRLTTFRASGEAVVTPVWFALVGEQLYVQTGGQTGKVRRIHRNAQVTVAPCTPWGKQRGPAIPATATDLGADASADVRAALARRYGLLQRLRDLVVRRKGIEFSFLRITAAPSSGASAGASADASPGRQPSD